MIKQVLLLFLVGSLFSSPSRAEETPAPCASEFKQSIASIGKPGSEQAEQAWRDCRARAEEQKKIEFAATANTWAAGLDRLPNGGWVLLEVSPDGTYAVFGSRRHETRKGGVVAVWLRYEYREGHVEGNTGFKSEVERTLYDCERIASKSISVAYYNESNLGGTAVASYTYDEGKVAWAPIIPGTLGDSFLEWACRTNPRVQPAKPH